jgi:hypothetical protein
VTARTNADFFTHAPARPTRNRVHSTAERSQRRDLSATVTVRGNGMGFLPLATVCASAAVRLE